MNLSFYISILFLTVLSISSLIICYTGGRIQNRNVIDVLNGGKQSILRANYDVTVISQSSYERVYFLPYWCERWQGPLSITFFLTANTSVLYNEIYDSLSLPKRLHISYYLSKSNGIYPINKLRNIAIDHVNTTHFWVADMDMWPSLDLYTTVTSLPKWYLEKSDVATIVPAFEYSLPQDAMCTTFTGCIEKIYRYLPGNKKDLIRCLKTGYCDRFREYTSTHSYHFNEWNTLPSDVQVTPVSCLINEIQEPYVIVRLTENLPRFDERFVNYGKNKVQWITHLRYSGFLFNVLSQSFAIDVPHPRSTMSTEWISEIRKTKGKTEMHLLMERFISEMKFNYSSNSVRTPLCSS